eukprot:5442879-Amphidinium_carterae.4
MAAMTVPLTQLLQQERIPHRCYVDDITVWKVEKHLTVQSIKQAAECVKTWTDAAGLEINDKTVIWSTSAKVRMQPVANALGVARRADTVKDLGGDFVIHPRLKMGAAQKQRVSQSLKGMTRLQRIPLPQWASMDTFRQTLYPRLLCSRSSRASTKATPNRETVTCS